MYIVTAVFHDKEDNFGNGEKVFQVETEESCYWLLCMLEENEYCICYSIFCTFGNEYVKDLLEEFCFEQKQFKKFKKSYKSLKVLYQTLRTTKTP